MLYFQDNFRATPRLTLNLGVRYEYNSPMHEANNSLGGFDPKTHAIVLQTSIDNLAKAGDVAPPIAAAYAKVGVTYETPAQAGLPRNLVYPNYHDFNPRLGFAYRLTTGEHYSVLRGGYGMFSFPDSLRLWNGNSQFTTPTTGFVANDPNTFANQSGDNHINWLLRSVPTVIAGQNSQNALDLSQVQGISPGSGQVFWVDPHEPTSRAEMWNLTYEKEVAPNTALSLGYVGTHAFRLPQYYSINDVPSDFIWYTNTGQPKPDNFVQQQPFDQVYGTMQEYRKTGWSNDNSFQVQLQHQYSKGYAYQVYYVLSNAFRAAGDGWRSDYVIAPNLFPAGTMPASQLLPLTAAPYGNTVSSFFYHEADRLQNYHRDTRVPQHRVVWNWIGDLPFGRGKMFGRNANGLLNAIIGGWQFAGDGTLFSRWFSPPTSLYGAWNGVQIYGKKYKVQDCTGGQCQSGYLWWNGYIPANVINQPGGVQGVPSNYKTSQTPRVPTPANGGSTNDPLYPYYESNEVCVNLAARTYQSLTVGSPCLAGTAGYQLVNESIDLGWWTNPWNPSNWNQYFRGPKEWNMDASFFKSFPIRESMSLRFNIDFFNVFNRPGTVMPNSSGISTNQFSDNPPRETQLTLRFTW